MRLVLYILYVCGFMCSGGWFENGCPDDGFDVVIVVLSWILLKSSLLQQSVHFIWFLMSAITVLLQFSFKSK